MRFEVRALRQHQVETLHIEASDMDEARTLVLSRSLIPIEVREAEGRHAGQEFELTLFVQELIELLDAGLELVEAIDALASHEQLARAERERLTQLLSRLRHGHSFSDALAYDTLAFPPLFVGLIRAAEQTSSLQEALERYADYSERFHDLRLKIRSALIYPSILLCVGGLVSLFLLGFVVPRFSAVYRHGKQNLPLFSQWLMSWGEFFSQHALMISVVVPLLLTILIFWARQAWRSGQLELLLRRLPGLGKQMDTFRISHLFLAVGTLINGGMSLVPALSLAEGVVPAHLLAQLRAARSELKRGVSASEAFAAHQLMTPVALRLLRAGEGSGKLGEMMLRAARYHDKQLARWIAQFSRIFEPVLMAVIGIFVGALVVLLYLPIFDLAGSLS